MSKSSNPFVFSNTFTSDNLKRLKELASLGAEYRQLKGVSKNIISADLKVIDKLNDIKRIVTPKTKKENA